MADAGVRRAAVLGSPIAHSLSPALHRAAYEGLGLPYAYDAIDVDEAALPAFIRGLDANWIGLSLTMPLKEAVLPLLDDVDETAREIRAVNTVLPTETGWRGTNTDVHGMTQALVEAGLLQAPHSAVILGSGATARSAVAALERLGTREVTICARRPDAAAEVAELATRFGLTAHVATLEPDVRLLRANVVISTLPGEAAAPWAPLADEASGALLDVSYHPWPTPLAFSWGGWGVASGRDMLLWQAVEQVRLMTGQNPDAARMAAALPR